MKTYRIKETLACWVEFTRTVRAESEDEAREKFYEGESSEEGAPEIGDCLSGYEQPLELTTF